MDEVYRIKDLFPDVSEIRIHYKEVYRSYFGIFNEEHTSVYTPDFLAEFPIDCINKSCTRKTFDLYGEVASAISHHQEQRTGTMQCAGSESEKHSHSCPVMLDYTIEIAYLP